MANDAFKRRSNLVDSKERLRAIFSTIRSADPGGAFSSSQLSPFVLVLEKTLNMHGPSVMRDAIAAVCELLRYCEQCERIKTKLRRDANKRRLQRDLVELKKRCEIAEALPVSIPSIKNELDRLLQESRPII